jgi:hypothetical protein
MQNLAIYNLLLIINEKVSFSILCRVTNVSIFIYLNEVIMEINWIIVGLVLFCGLILIVFLIRKNQKDKKKYKQFLNNDFKKTTEEQSDWNDEIH